MASHGRTKGRHPNPTRFLREQWPVGHITFEVCDNPKAGCTFALIPGEAPDAKLRKALFTGIIQKGMGTQLRRLAHRFDELEAKIGADDE